MPHFKGMWSSSWRVASITSGRKSSLGPWNHRTLTLGYWASVWGQCGSHLPMPPSWPPRSAGFPLRRAFNSCSSDVQNSSDPEPGTPSANCSWISKAPYSWKPAAIPQFLCTSAMLEEGTQSPFPSPAKTRGRHFGPSACDAPWLGNSF